MKIAYVYATNHLYHSPDVPYDAIMRRMGPAAPLSGRHFTSSVAMIEALRSAGVTETERWTFWQFPSETISRQGLMPRRWFRSNGETSEDLARHVAAAGQPDILWIEGPRNPPQLRQVTDLCPDSFKIAYSQNWKPWRMDGLDRYDLCFVDEEWQRDRLAKHAPGLRCAVWDKLIDYERGHYPIESEKTYDLCIVAEPRPRKNHELLFRAMAELKSRRDLTCVAIGGDYKGRRSELEQLVRELGVSVHFAGELSKAEVNAMVNRSRVGVVPAKRDAAPRVILEFMASNVPQLVNAELRAGARYVGPRAGIVAAPEDFPTAIEELLDNPDRFAPREHLLQHYAREQVLARFLDEVKAAGLDLRGAAS